jgi:YVTN family beta-propeller protein
MVGRAIHWNRARRAGDRSACVRAAALASVLLGASGVCLGEASGAIAAGFEAKPVVAAGGELKAATLATPTGLTAGDGGCETSSEDTWVSLEWTGSAVLDADGNPLVNRYAVTYSPSSAGTYTAAGETSGATSFRQSGPAGAETPQIYIANNGAKTVHAVDAATNAGTSITTNGTVGEEPNGLAVNPEGTKVIVAEGASSEVQVITVASHAIGAKVEVPKVGGKKSRPDAVAITPSGQTAYIVDGANNLVYPFTISSSTLGTGIAVGTQGDPGAIAVSPNGEDVYVANYGSRSVSVISTATNKVTATVTIGAGTTGKPIALAVSANSAHLYVADQGHSQIDDIATASNTVAHTVEVGSLADPNLAAGGDPNILAVNPEGTKLYVASYTGHGVEDIATATDAVTKTITLQESTTAAPNALAMTPNGCQLYVNDYEHNLVDVINVSSDAVTAHPAIGETKDPTGMSVTPDGSHVYIADRGGTPQVSVIATSNNTVSATLAEGAIGKTPTAVLATPSPYYYKLQAGHGGWRSPATAAVMYPLGWDQGGSQ